MTTPRVRARHGPDGASRASSEQRQRTTRSDARWRVVAGAEVVAVVAAVLTDWAIPAVVIVVLAGLSLILRRCGPSTLGFHRVSRPWRLVAGMAGFAVAWTLVNVAILIPLTNHLSGTRQDVIPMMFVGLHTRQADKGGHELRGYACLPAIAVLKRGGGGERYRRVA